MTNQLNDSWLMKHLMDNIKDNIYFMDRAGHMIKINQAGAEWLGYKTPEELIGKTDLDIFSFEHGSKAFDDGQHIMNTGEPLLGIEEKETWADGHESWVSTSKMPMRNESGEIVGIVGVSRDITEHKLAEIRAAKYADENRNFREVMEEDLRMAAELQKTFFPSNYPVFPEGVAAKDSLIHFHHDHHSGGMVGGDFCSIRKLSDTEVGVFLCDVMGHGVRASLGTAIVRAMVEEISLKEKDPARFLKHMNRVLMPIMRQDDLFLYATACYMVVNVEKGEVCYANAGHPVPIHLDSSTGQAAWFCDDCSLTGPALAITEDAQYFTVSRKLNLGDAVFMFTDGIFEVSDGEQEEFGEERLLETAQQHGMLPLPYLFPALLDEARRFAAEGAFDDDVCLVGFRLLDLLTL